MTRPCLIRDYALPEDDTLSELGITDCLKLVRVPSVCSGDLIVFEILKDVNSDRYDQALVFF